ncbi:hypothetical protein SEVIR_7G319200v4 [Setaria viridis]|uniref:Uncharacterized protein n=1 Tax=Setaria viridis TaxID=4556 RepID=A0A4U6U254_SETVI|nr:uncharacterized protein LOC117862455 [Setaria viridis]TKW07623.1 hypothetical protein SEVIR_7G319200v2 [Setaria viridis]
MASSAFRSTTRRDLHASSTTTSRSDPPPCPRRSRSRSVSAAPRARGHDSLLQEDYANTRTNPLFDSAASPSPPQQPVGSATGAGGGDAPTRDRGREPLKVGGRGGGGRARSVSVAPQRRDTASAPSVDSAGAVGGRRASRARSVADEVRPYRCSETDTEARDAARKLQSWRSRHSISESKQGGIGGSCSSQGSTTGVGSRQMDETTCLESSTVVSSPGHHLEHAIWQQNHSTVPVDPVLEIPPEFDPDSAEFISDLSDYATEYRKKDVVEIPLDFDTDAAELDSDARNNAAKQHRELMEIPLEFDTDASELVSDIWHHEANQQLGQLEAPLEYDPDTSELAPDITEYTIKLKQSHERARKLRADLAVEEQREQELSRMLKGIVTAPNFTETHKKRPRRKSSIERLKVSRHLAEEALNYFEECVSISTMDSTDFSSPEDHQPNSVLNVQPKSNSRFFHKGRSSFQEPHTPADQHGHHEELDKQTQCSISITGSDVSDGVIFSNTKCHMKFRNNSSEDLDGFDTPRSRSSCFSFTHESIKNVENCDVRQYLGNFGMGNNKELRETRSSYFADDYVSQKVNPDILKDMATFQNRMQYGGFLICNIRTF